MRAQNWLLIVLSSVFIKVGAFFAHRSRAQEEIVARSQESTADDLRHLAQKVGKDAGKESQQVFVEPRGCS
jgi:hypothetical protein